MIPPTVVAKEGKDPILIVDREGEIGKRLAEKLKTETTVVLVSEKSNLPDIIHIPYDKKIPQIPDNTYSHIFVIDDGENVTREALPSFLEKAENDNSVFLFAAHMREINEKLINDLTSYYQKAKILFFGDLFGGGPVDKESYIIKFIAQARLKNKIVIPGDGVAVSYPIFFEDLIDGILEAVFGQEGDKVYYAFPKTPPTLLTLARVIQKSNPHITLDFTKGKEEKNISIPTSGKYLLEENYKLETRIKKIKIEESTFEEKEEIKDEIEEPRRIKFKFPKMGFLGILFLIFLPVVSTLLLSLLGNISFKGVEFYLDRGDLDKAQKSAVFGRTYFDLANKTSSLVPLLDKNIVLKDRDKVLGASLILSGIKFADFSDVKKGITYLQKEKVNFPMLDFSTVTISVWEDLLGVSNKRKYLMLLQDKNELRPTGGVIDSFAILSLDKGKLLPFEIKDASIPDAKARGQVEPPFPIRRYLKSSNLLFKDSNFNIDFTESASSSAVLLSVLEEEKVDGVIALDKSLYGEISEELKKDQPSYKKILSAIEEGIDKKQILFAFNDQNLQNIFTVNSWSSSLWDGRTDSSTVANDFLGISEANLSKNKINEKIKRSVDHDIKLSKEGDLTSVLTINYRNEATQAYKNYLRIIIPEGSEISEIKINDVVLETRTAIKTPNVYEARNFREPEELELDEYNQNGKTIFGFYHEIGAEAVEEVQITYTLAKKVDVDSHFSYSLKIFKQPSMDFPYEFSFFPPEEFKITSGNKNYEKEILKDETLLIDFAKI